MGAQSAKGKRELAEMSGRPMQALMDTLKAVEDGREFLGRGYRRHQWEYLSALGDQPVGGFSCFVTMVLRPSSRNRREFLAAQ